MPWTTGLVTVRGPNCADCGGELRWNLLAGCGVVTKAMSGFGAASRNHQMRQHNAKPR